MIGVLGYVTLLCAMAVWIMPALGMGPENAQQEANLAPFHTIFPYVVGAAVPFLLKLAIHPRAIRDWHTGALVEVEFLGLGELRWYEWRVGVVRRGEIRRGFLRLSRSFLGLIPLGSTTRSMREFVSVSRGTQTLDFEANGAKLTVLEFQVTLFDEQGKGLTLFVIGQWPGEREAWDLARRVKGELEQHLPPPSLY